MFCPLYCVYILLTYFHQKENKHGLKYCVHVANLITLKGNKHGLTKGVICSMRY